MSTVVDAIAPAADGVDRRRAGVGEQVQETPPVREFPDASRA